MTEPTDEQREVRLTQWAAQQKQDSKHPPLKIKALAGAALVGLVAIGGLLSLADGDEDSDTAEDRQFAAFDVCKQFVADQLRSPGTAEFRNYFEDDGEVVVTGVGDGPTR